jgi:hypothetical protein
MKRFEATLSSTAIDGHGEMMSRGALESAAAALKRNLISMGVEHDPRNPPIGRVTDAWVEDVENGLSLLKGVGELFEPGDSLPPNVDKTIVEREYSRDKLILGFDRTYDNPDFEADIQAIVERFGTEPRLEIKKAVEPLSILTIGGAFVLGAIASGFFGQIGADAYLWLKTHLGRLIEKQRQTTKEQLLVFEFSVTCEGHRVLVQTILPSPKSDDIDAFLRRAIYELDRIPPDWFNPVQYLSRLVYFFENGKLEFKYAVRTDGFPINYKVAT